MSASTAIRLDGASVAYGERTLWSGLDLDVAAGEILAVLGPNGAGKTTLLKVLLGLLPLSAGSALVNGRSPRRGSTDIGYVPQQRAFDRDLPIRGRDLVAFGLDGHRRGLPRSNARARALVAEAVDAVGAAHFADAPIGALSGGEQQRLRIAQALLGDPAVLLCDEPLLSLDLSQQRAVTALIDRRRRDAGTAVVFVTHEINPILSYVDRVLYLVPATDLSSSRWAVGTPDEVLTDDTLSRLYGIQIDVLRVRGRIIVVGADDDDAHHSQPAGVPPARAVPPR